MELLAPAGNMECLKAAVNNGADAVYFAGKSFGARSFANNFTSEEMYDAIKYCRLRKVKSYVTVNTMTLDREFRELDEFISLLADAGADGVIVQDLGVLKRISQICPQMPIHGSTQMTVHNLDGVRALEKLGVSRVVLSRELSQKDIEYIINNCKAEIEVFVHGAMCMSYSGQCLMSSVLGGRSGNRGKCAQPCRLEYHDKGSKDRFYMSLKDMSLLNYLEELRDMGVASLKIEGRMKGIEYVSRVVRTYRDCIDELRKPSKEELDGINRVFFRGGLSDGYYKNHIGPSMFAFDKPDNPYKKGEELVQADAKERLNGVSVKGLFAESEVPMLVLKTEDKEIVVKGEEPLSVAMKNPANSGDIEKQLGKMGGTAFYMKECDIEIKGNPFVPVREVNALRRSALEKLEKELLKDSRKDIIHVAESKEDIKIKSGFSFTASVKNFEQYMAIKEYDFKYIDVPVYVVEKNTEIFFKDKERIILNLPVIVKDSEKENWNEVLNLLSSNGFDKLRVQNIDRIFSNKNYRIFCGERLNVANSRALRMFAETGAETVCLSSEMNLAQIRDIDKVIETESIIYGHTALMITENCVLKNAGKCPCKGFGEIYDRKNSRFYIIKDGQSCRNIILNSVPLYMGDKVQDIKNCGVNFGRLDFTVESPELCREVCRKYFKNEKSDGEFTRLHFYKGVL